MSGLPWFQLHINLPTHPKSIRLGTQLRDSRAWTHMVQLWTWMGANCPSGRIEGEDATAIIEYAAGWTGNPGVFAAAAVKVDFLQAEESGALRSDGWIKRNQAHLAKLEKDAERQRFARKNQRNRFGPKLAPSEGRPSDVRVTSADDQRSHSDVQRKRKTNTNTNRTVIKEDEARGAATGEPSHTIEATERTSPPKEIRPTDVPASLNFFNWAQDDRKGVLPDSVREAPPYPSKLASWYADAVRELNGDEWRLRAAYQLYLEDEWGRDRSPPWPFVAFMKLWANHLPTPSKAAHSPPTLEVVAPSCMKPGCDLTSCSEVWGRRVCLGHGIWAADERYAEQQTKNEPPQQETQEAV